MKILGIDTSTKICSLGLIEEEAILIEYTFNNLQKKHSSVLMPAIKDIFEKVNLKLQDIDGIAVSLGPGSFTGLRISLGVAKGLSYASSLPLLGIPTLDALAFSLKGVPCLICPILDAKKDEIYNVVFRGGNNFKKVMDYKCEDINSLLIRLSSLKEKIIFIGEGLIRYQEIIKEKIGKDALFIDPQLVFPRGANIAFLGLEKLKKGKEDNISTLSPLYLRKSEAEMAWEKKYN
ncbi:MAG: tRNA (adenosine(37)-N6)-threonylcarbamoyltransferase complex dimerization subunit type 1 TsaB [Candidatus Atribacteria bacterium]|nr:tRNA (adenosine(37)-N6)-threonylcarbamoyltransferase complex dimerization subunit type 1 TsaB [Candidatus Atribacteria bacterium]MCK4308946.1 tRNA (adenosine(37)-N6)-threonylcarbamoyltransferase complex dimerization subunit type 1 TsaB [Candidatus Atribacteria bacterium]